MNPRASIFAAVIAFASATPAFAFDCGKAATVVEKAICASPQLKDIDDGLEAAYGEVKSLSTKNEQKMLARAQRKWVAEREANCPQSALGLDGCISDMTGTRLRMFRGEAQSGPGSGGRIIPVFVTQEGSEQAYDIDVSLLRFASPKTAAERAFNAIASESVKRLKLGNHGEDTMGSIYAVEEWMTLNYASPAFVSLARGFWVNTGGAHGNGGIENFNIDMTSGRTFTIADFFSGKAAEELAAQCKAQIIAEKGERNSGGPYDPAQDSFLKDEVIAEHIATLSRWGFTAVEASVSFDAYAIGPYAEGSYDCRFTMPRLREIALPGAPLP